MISSWTRHAFHELCVLSNHANVPHPLPNTCAMSPDGTGKREAREPDEKASLKGHDSVVELSDSKDSRSPSMRDGGLTAKLENPLAGLTHEQLLVDAAEFARTHGLGDYTETLQKGALLAQDPAAFESLPMLTEEDRRVLRREFTHRWDHPKTLYYLVIMCSVAAAVQGVSPFLSYTLWLANAVYSTCGRWTSL